MIKIKTVAKMIIENITFCIAFWRDELNWLGIGFDWKTIDGVKDKIHEELSELDHEIIHGTKEKISNELGIVIVLGHYIDIYNMIMPATWHGCTA